MSTTKTRAGDSQTAAPDASPDAPPSDDALRRIAAARLTEYLDHGDTLLRRCAELARQKRGDRLGPLAAAARLLSANARVAQALAQVALVERRQRTIVERIQPPDPRKAELISQKMSEALAAEVRLKVARRMDEVVAQSIRARSGETQESDRVARMIQGEERTLAHIRKQLNDLGVGE